MTAKPPTPKPSTPKPPTPKPSTPKPSTPKAQRTRAAIIEAALRLFEAHGFDDTSMRAIAKEAGVSLGNAYYYFASKEELIVGFYAWKIEQHRDLALPALDGVDDLAERIVTTLGALVETLGPHHAFAGTFLARAADPTSLLSPFGEPSVAVRTLSVALWRRVVDGARPAVPPVLSGELPHLLWLYSLGVTLFWVHDRSEGWSRTDLLVRRTAPIIARAVELASLPFLESTVRDLMGLVAALRPG